MLHSRQKLLSRDNTTRTANSFTFTVLWHKPVSGNKKKWRSELIATPFSIFRSQG
jgi:hypothetical protein